MVIDYKNVVISHEDDVILSDVDFKVDEGEFIYIIGKVGSGKSSLMRTLYCELDINSADKTMVLDRDVMKIKRKNIPQLRKEMGIVFQDFKLLQDRTVRRNLKFVLRATGWQDNDEIDARINEVLTEVDMLDAKERMPYQLSGGEQQRIAIARAMLNKPKIILADEPTGHLDVETADNILVLLRKINSEGTTVIMSTHNLALVEKYPATVYCCQDGKFMEVTDDYMQVFSSISDDSSVE